MKHGARILINIFFLIVCASVTCIAKEWRDIVPLLSTRADVIKLLGNPTHSLEDSQEYFVLENETVKFEWIDPTCVRKYPIESENEVRPDDLVLSITVVPKTPMSQVTIYLPSAYVTICLANISCTYITFDGDVAVHAAKGVITDICYGPTDKEFKAWLQRHSACQESPQVKNSRL